MLYAQDVYQDFTVSKGYQSFFLKSVVKTDSYRNIYQAGATIGDDGDYDVILSKSDRNGDEIWTRVYDVAGYDDAAVDFGIDVAGNIYVTGTTYNPSNSGYSLLTVKYSSSGTLLWHHTYSYPGSLYNVATSISIDNSRIYIGGVTYNLQNEADFLALSYSPSGNIIWNYSWDNVGLNDGVTSIYKKGNKLLIAGGTEVSQNKWQYCIQVLSPTNGTIADQSISGGTGDGIDRITDLTRDNAGNVYVTGGVVNQNTGYDYRTLKLDSTLNILWSKTFNSAGSYDDIANSLAVDNSGNVYVTGQSQTGQNGTDYTTLKYSAGGGQVWAKTYNGSANGADSAKAIVVDASQNVIITGTSYNGTNTDFHTIKYTSSGNEIWNIDFNGIENGDDNAFDIALDEHGDIIVGGQTSSNGRYRYVAVKYKEVEVTSPFGNTSPTNNEGDFTANYGQLYDLANNGVDQIRYSGSDRNASLFLIDTAMSYTLATSDGNPATDDMLCGFNLKPYTANSVRIYGKEKSNGYNNYYFPHIPKGRERVPSYKTLVYPNLWRSVDVTVTNGTEGANYYYVVKKGGLVSSLDLLLSGQTSVSVDPVSDELVVGTDCGTYRLPAPSAYQIGTNGQIINLSWTPQYTITGNHITFTTGTYNTNLPLVIALERGGGSDYDVIGLCWSTYFSGYGTVESAAIQYNNEDLVIGSANVSPGSFVFSTYSSSPFNESDYKACVFKLYANHGLNWMSFYGGSNQTYVTDIARNSKEEVYCIGTSAAQDLVLHPESGATSYSYSGQGATSGTFAFDVLLFKFKPIDGSLMWSTFMGDSGSNFGNDFGKNIIVTSDDKIYITGTASGTNFQHTSSSNSYQGGASDVFLAEFNANDLHTYTYFLGGTNKDRPYGLDQDDSGNIWIQGSTNSSNFPTVNPNISDPDVFFDNQLNGLSDDFVAQISSTSHSVIYSTYFGGNKSESDFYPRLVVHTDYLTTGKTKLYMVGRTKSSGTTFPIYDDGGYFDYNINNLGSDTYSSPSNGYYWIGYFELPSNVGNIHE